MVEINSLKISLSPPEMWVYSILADFTGYSNAEVWLRVLKFIIRAFRPGTLYSREFG